MAVQRTVHETLEYLTQATGRRETEVLAEALEHGLNEIYRKHIITKYQEGALNRKEAADLLGTESVEKIDYAWQAISQDVKWGLSGE